MVKAQILVVEDEYVVALEIQSRLIDLGYAVLAIVSSGQEAVEKAAEMGPDLVLMDIKLKGEMDGVEAAEQIRARFEIPVIYLTAYADEPTLQWAKTTEPFGYLLKPIKERELSATIEMALRKHEVEKELREYRERLEELVVRRTVELTRANEKLQQEIDERKWANEQLQQEIDERRRVEKALRESESLYRLLAENVTDVIWVTDMDMRLTYITPSVTRLLGYSVEEAMALTIEEVMTPASLEVVVKNREAGVALMKTGQESYPTPQPQELELYCKDGSTVWVEAKVTLLREQGGRPVGVMGVNRDITERKRAEEARRESEARYRTLVEQIPAVTYIAALDEISTTLYFSPQIEKILGFTQAEWLAQPDLFFRQLHPDDRERVMAELTRSRASGEPFESEYRLLARDDRVVWFRDEAVVVRDDADNPLFLQGVMFDITERKQAEE